MNDTKVIKMLKYIGFVISLALCYGFATSFLLILFVRVYEFPNISDIQKITWKSLISIIGVINVSSYPHVLKKIFVY